MTHEGDAAQATPGRWCPHAWRLGAACLEVPADPTELQGQRPRAACFPVQASCFSPGWCGVPAACYLKTASSRLTVYWGTAHDWETQMLLLGSESHCQPASLGSERTSRFYYKGSQWGPQGSAVPCPSTRSGGRDPQGGCWPFSSRGRWARHADTASEPLQEPHR